MMYSGPFKISRILPVGYIPTEGNISLCAALYIWLDEPGYIITVKYIDGEFNDIFLYVSLATHSVNSIGNKDLSTRSKKNP